jgi:hypothetical protein
MGLILPRAAPLAGGSRPFRAVFAEAIIGFFSFFGLHPLSGNCSILATNDRSVFSQRALRNRCVRCVNPFVIPFLEMPNFKN